VDTGTKKRNEEKAYPSIFSDAYAPRNLMGFVT
jgi:hypothetical protein